MRKNQRWRRKVTYNAGFADVTVYCEYFTNFHNVWSAEPVTLCIDIDPMASREAGLGAHHGTAV